MQHPCPLTLVGLVADLASGVVLLVDPFLNALLVRMALGASAATGRLQVRQGIFLKAYPAGPRWYGTNRSEVELSTLR
jgi:hypothetical protein